MDSCSTLRTVARIALGVASVFLATGCTVHPRGEVEERNAAFAAGRQYANPPEQRVIPALSADPSPEELVRFALLSNAELEQKYWEWRSALEQIPQDGTQATNLALSANLAVARGRSGFDRTVLSGGNDPMADIVFPPKLSIAAQRALEVAKAAGRRHRKSQIELRSKVLGAYYDYALTAELIRLEQANLQLLKTTAMVVEARNRAGAAAEEVFKARNELDLSRNDLASMQSQLVSELATINALLGRAPGAEIAIPAGLPSSARLTLSDEAIMTLAANQNPELAAQSREIDGKRDSVKLAKLQYVPDFSVSAATDLEGVGQNVLASITVPYLRHEAIDAAISQADANLRASEAMRRQAHLDLDAQVISDLRSVRDWDRQTELLQQTVIPRARQAVNLARSAYEAGHSTLLDLLESQRSLISIERFDANVRTLRAKRTVELEAISGWIPQADTGRRS